MIKQNLKNVIVQKAKFSEDNSYYFIFYQSFRIFFSYTIALNMDSTYIIDGQEKKIFIRNLAFLSILSNTSLSSSLILKNYIKLK